MYIKTQYQTPMLVVYYKVFDFVRRVAVFSFSVNGLLQEYDLACSQYTKVVWMPHRTLISYTSSADVACGTTKGKPTWLPIRLDTRQGAPGRSARYSPCQSAEFRLHVTIVQKSMIMLAVNVVGPSPPRASNFSVAPFVGLNYQRKSHPVPFGPPWCLVDWPGPSPLAYPRIENINGSSTVTNIGTMHSITPVSMTCTYEHALGLIIIHC